LARYRAKSEADLAWEEIRRAYTYRANLAAATAKARYLNDVLPRAQEKFESALKRGELLELPQGLDLIDAIELEIRGTKG
jgi:hypothetical protein